jgi:hypothetical protein
MLHANLSHRALILAVLLCLPPTGLVAQNRPVVRELILQEQAARALTLVYRRHETELLGCLIGTIGSDTALVTNIAPADVDPVHSTPTHVLPTRNCEEAGWQSAIGMIHTHPTAERCWYFLPGTRVPSSDGQSYLNGSYAVDAILCGDVVVWINSELVERRSPMKAPPPSPP